MQPQPDVPIDLIERAQSCSKSAENELFQKLRARILPLAQRRLCRGKREHVETPEGIVQEVCMVMCQPDRKTGKRKYKTIAQDRFWGWIFTILRNKIGDYLRKAKMNLLEDIPIDPQTASEEIELEQWERELDQVILRALQRLDEKCRQTIRALILESKGFKLPAELASLPSSTWHPRVHRCRRKFRELLRKEGLEL